MNQQTSTFVEEVNQAVHWKAQAANGLADAHAKYESVKRRGSNRINLSLYNKRYLELRNSSEQLFNEGNYKEAMERIAAVTAIIQSMESDYQPHSQWSGWQPNREETAQAMGAILPGAAHGAAATTKIPQVEVLGATMAKTPPGVQNGSTCNLK